MTTQAPRLGPLVHRSVHHAAALWLVGSLQFVVAMIVVQLAWKGPPGYSLSQNYISDLGNTGCGAWPNATSHIVCSPWHSVFNGSIIVLGIFLVLGAILIRTAFPARRSSRLGLGLIALGALGSVGVGLSPENVNGAVHSASSLVAFLAGNLALMVLGFAMFRDTRWDGFRAYSLLSGLVGLVATFLLLGGRLPRARGRGDGAPDRRSDPAVADRGLGPPASDPAVRAARGASVPHRLGVRNGTATPTSGTLVPDGTRASRQVANARSGAAVGS